MKKLLFLFLLIPCISFAGNGKEYPIYRYIDVVKKTVIETQYIKVKVWDIDKYSKGETFIINNETNTIIIKIEKKTSKIK